MIDRGGKAGEIGAGAAISEADGGASVPALFAEARTGIARSLERIVGLAADLLDAPMALVGAGEPEEVRIHAHTGIPEERVPDFEPLVARLAAGGEPVVIEDANESDPHELAAPLRDLDVRYASAHPFSVDLEDGRVVGTVALFDRRPRRPSPAETETLRGLAEWAHRELALWAWLRGTVTLAHGLERLRRDAWKIVEATPTPELFPASIAEAPPTEPTRPLRDLTPRQRQVLLLIAEGNTSKEIASRLGISAKTVETHRRDLMNRLDIHDIAGLVRFAVGVGLVGTGR